MREIFHLMRFDLLRFLPWVAGWWLFVVFAAWSPLQEALLEKDEALGWFSSLLFHGMWLGVGSWFLFKSDSAGLVKAAWRTRPIQGHRLVASKLLFLLTFVQAPAALPTLLELRDLFPGSAGALAQMLAAQASSWLLLLVAALLPGFAWSQGGSSHPVFSRLDRLMKFILGMFVFILFLRLQFGTALPFDPGKDFRFGSPQQQALVLFGNLAAVLLCVIVLFHQYRTRRPVWPAVVATLGLGLSIALPPRLIVQWPTEESAPGATFEAALTALGPASDSPPGQELPPRALYGIVRFSSEAHQLWPELQQSSSKLRSPTGDKLEGWNVSVDSRNEPREWVAGPGIVKKQGAKLEREWQVPVASLWSRELRTKSNLLLEARMWVSFALFRAQPLEDLAVATGERMAKGGKEVALLAVSRGHGSLELEIRQRYAPKWPSAASACKDFLLEVPSRASGETFFLKSEGLHLEASLWPRARQEIGPGLQVSQVAESFRFVLPATEELAEDWQDRARLICLESKVVRDYSSSLRFGPVELGTLPALPALPTQLP